jgi:prepilin-type N-terminal cleavage/methylation domain-containing protein
VGILAIRVEETMMMRKRGFTLIELVVVISIIIVLAGILIPVVMNAKRKADEHTCVAYLAHVGRAVVMYRQEVNQYPSPGAPVEALYRAQKLPEVFTCPFDPAKADRHDTYSQCYNYWGYKRNGSAPAPVKNRAEAVANYCYQPNNATAPNLADPTTLYTVLQDPGKEIFRMSPADRLSVPSVLDSIPGSDFPGLVNPNAPAYTVITACPHHRDDRIPYVRVDQSAQVMKAPNDLTFWALSKPEK